MNTIFAVELLVAVQSPFGVGIMVALALAAALLVPYLVKEIRKGKSTWARGYRPDRASRIPVDEGNPAPGHPEAQADPYDRGRSDRISA